MKRHATTAIASILLTLAVPGIWAAGTALYASLRLGSKEIRESLAVLNTLPKEKGFPKLDATPPPKDILLTNSVLELASQGLLLASGILIALRSPRSVALMLLTIAASLMAAFYYLLAALPVLKANFLAPSRVCPTCAAIVNGLWIVGYIAVLVYLRLPATRLEFGETTRVAA